MPMEREQCKWLKYTTDNVLHTFMSFMLREKCAHLLGGSANKGSSRSIYSNRERGKKKGT